MSCVFAIIFNIAIVILFLSAAGCLLVKVIAAMTHLNFDNDINSLLRLDGPTGGPAMRWQRKASEAPACNTSLNRSLNRSLSKSLGNISGLSPMKAANQSFGGSKTPSKSKTPNGKRSKTPGMEYACLSEKKITITT